jgi:hypothetical protein
MSEVKYTRKASTRIIKELLKINPKVSGNTTFDQAFVELMEYWDLELGVENKLNKTYCYIFKDGNVVNEFILDNQWNEKEGDWDWNVIYKTTLETIIKLKLYKRPKVSKRELNRIAKEKAEQEKLKAKAEKEAAKAAAIKAKEDAKLAKLKAKAEKEVAKAKTKTKTTRKTKA